MNKPLEAPDWLESRSYQKEAIQSWIKMEGKGIFEMATGTGKTVTALSAATELCERLDEELLIIIAVPYQHLVDQWEEVLKEFNVHPILAYESRRRWLTKFESSITELTRGFREFVVVVTTHDTFSSNIFQRVLDRSAFNRSLLIADEVHHLGASHYSQNLPDKIQFRLGLSATPNRFYDQSGTMKLKEYFGPIVFSYSLSEAIENCDLTGYYYIPHIVNLTSEEAQEYINISTKIARNIAHNNDEDTSDHIPLENNDRLKHLLFQRSRLVGTAKNKILRLKKLINDRDQISHTLIYCGDGSTDRSRDNRTERHVDATLAEMRMSGVYAKRFTADESRSEREELLNKFEAGDIEALVAIRCLDEGVDVPATETAYILASSSNPRQFVQRRGRILRNHPGKQHATIHDFIVAPPEALWANKEENKKMFSVERRLVKRELDRVELFAESARNHPDADIPDLETDAGALGELKTHFNLRQY